MGVDGHGEVSRGGLVPILLSLVPIRVSFNCPGEVSPKCQVLIPSTFNAHVLWVLIVLVKISQGPGTYPLIPIEPMCCGC